MTPQSDQLSNHLLTYFPIHHKFYSSEELQTAITNYNSSTSLKIYISHSVLIESCLKIKKNSPKTY